MLRDIIKKNIKLLKIVAAVLPPIVAIAIILYIKYYYTPSHGIACFTYKYMGLYCMGCGSTRQLYYFLNGEIIEAFKLNIACVVIYPTYAYIYYLILRWSIKDKKITYNQAYIVAASAILLSLYAIIRNIPIRALDFLRP